MARSSWREDRRSVAISHPTMLRRPWPSWMVTMSGNCWGAMGGLAMHLGMVLVILMAFGWTLLHSPQSDQGISSEFDSLSEWR